MLTEEEAEALDAWAWLRYTDRPENHTNGKGYTYKTRAANEWYMRQVVESLGIAPRWIARALWYYYGTRRAKQIARKVTSHRLDKGLENLIPEKTAQKIATTKIGGNPQQMLGLVQELRVGDWTTARKLYRAGMLMPADLEGMTAEPMNRHTIRKRLSTDE
jgi:hypothetical protein